MTHCFDQRFLDLVQFLCHVLRTFPAEEHQRLGSFVAVTPGEVKVRGVGHESESSDENHRHDEAEDVKENITDVRSDAVRVKNPDYG